MKILGICEGVLNVYITAIPNKHCDACEDFGHL